MRTSLRRGAVAVSLAVGAAVLTTPVALPAGAAPSTAEEREHRRDLNEARRATAKFHDIRKALDAGYLEDPHCVADPALGGMGHHYVKPSAVGAGSTWTPDPAEPSALLYAPDSHGRLRLVALEWIYFEDTGQPSLFGVPFDGPMPGHSATMPVHYDLHVWLWERNPDGMFAAWNPAVSC